MKKTSSSSSMTAKRSSSRSRGSGKRHSSFHASGKKTKNVLTLVPKRTTHDMEDNDEEIVVPQTSIKLVFDHDTKSVSNEETADKKPSIRIEQASPSRTNEDEKEVDKDRRSEATCLAVPVSGAVAASSKPISKPISKSISSKKATMRRGSLQVGQSIETPANRKGSLSSESTASESTSKPKSRLWTTALSVQSGVSSTWLPPNWEQTLAKLKESGRDLASIDTDLKSIAQVEKTRAKSTGKYLMPEDLIWCRGHTHFAEKEVLKWFRTFRAALDKKVESSCIDKDTFAHIINDVLPLANANVLANIVFDIFGRSDHNPLDFKEFLWCVDVVCCKDLAQKLRWAFNLIDREKKGCIDRSQIVLMLQLLDQVEVTGVSCEESVEEWGHRRKADPLLPIEERASAIMRVGDADGDGNISILELTHLKEKIIFARESL